MTTKKSFWKKGEDNIKTFTAVVSFGVMLVSACVAGVIRYNEIGTTATQVADDHKLLIRNKIEMDSIKYNYALHTALQEDRISDLEKTVTDLQNRLNGTK